MAKKKRRKQKKNRGWMWFGIGMLVYTLVCLGGIYYGLTKLWVFLEAYEASRPYHAVDSYMEQLTREHIAEYASDIIAEVDLNLQSQEECQQLVLDAISGDISYARKASECTDTRQVYAVSCGDVTVGSFAIESGEADEYGFASWHYADESYDLSFLEADTTVTATAPEGCLVYVNGILLDESYIVEQDISQYDVFAEFYDDYDLPVYTLYTYKAGPFMGEVTLEVTDAQGNPYEYDPDLDINTLVDNCTDGEIEELDTFINEFIKRYVTFTGSANRSENANYQSLVAMVVSGSDLASRMQKALDGLHWAQSKGDTIESITVNHYCNIGDDKYLCDVTYVVNTTGNDGVVETTLSVKIIVDSSGSSLLAEAMTSY